MKKLFLILSVLILGTSLFAGDCILYDRYGERLEESSRIAEGQIIQTLDKKVTFAGRDFTVLLGNNSMLYLDTITGSMPKLFLISGSMTVETNSLDSDLTVYTPTTLYSMIQTGQIFIESTDTSEKAYIMDGIIYIYDAVRNCNIQGNLFDVYDLFDDVLTPRQITPEEYKRNAISVNDEYWNILTYIPVPEPVATIRTGSVTMREFGREHVPQVNQTLRYIQEKMPRVPDEIRNLTNVSKKMIRLPLPVRKINVTTERIARVPMAPNFGTTSIHYLVPEIVKPEEVIIDAYPVAPAAVQEVLPEPEIVLEQEEPAAVIEEDTVMESSAETVPEAKDTIVINMSTAKEKENSSAGFSFSYEPQLIIPRNVSSFDMHHRFTLKPHIKLSSFEMGLNVDMTADKKFSTVGSNTVFTKGEDITRYVLGYFDYIKAGYPNNGAYLNISRENSNYPSESRLYAPVMGLENMSIMHRLNTSWYSHTIFMDNFIFDESNNIFASFGFKSNTSYRFRFDIGTAMTFTKDSLTLYPEVKMHFPVIDNPKAVLAIDASADLYVPVLPEFRIDNIFDVNDNLFPNIMVSADITLDTKYIDANASVSYSNGKIHPNLFSSSLGLDTPYKNDQIISITAGMKVDTKPFDMNVYFYFPIDLKDRTVAAYQSGTYGADRLYADLSINIGAFSIKTGLHKPDFITSLSEAAKAGDFLAFITDRAGTPGGTKAYVGAAVNVEGFTLQADVYPKRHGGEIKLMSDFIVRYDVNFDI